MKKAIRIFTEKTTLSSEGTALKITNLIEDKLRASSQQSAMNDKTREFIKTNIHDALLEVINYSEYQAYKNNDEVKELLATEIVSNTDYLARFSADNAKGDIAKSKSLEIILAIILITKTPSIPKVLLKNGINVDNSTKNDICNDINEMIKISEDLQKARREFTIGLQPAIFKAFQNFNNDIDDFTTTISSNISKLNIITAKKNMGHLKHTLENATRAFGAWYPHVVGLCQPLLDILNNAEKHFTLTAERDRTATVSTATTSSSATSAPISSTPTTTTTTTTVTSSIPVPSQTLPNTNLTPSSNQAAVANETTAVVSNAKKETQEMLLLKEASEGNTNALLALANYFKDKDPFYTNKCYTAYMILNGFIASEAFEGLNTEKLNAKRCLENCDDDNLEDLVLFLRNARLTGNQEQLYSLQALKEKYKINNPFVLILFALQIAAEYHLSLGMKKDDIITISKQIETSLQLIYQYAYSETEAENLYRANKQAVIDLQNKYFNKTPVPADATSNSSGTLLPQQRSKVGTAAKQGRVEQPKPTHPITQVTTKAPTSGGLIRQMKMQRQKQNQHAALQHTVKPYSAGQAAPEIVNEQDKAEQKQASLLQQLSIMHPPTHETDVSSQKPMEDQRNTPLNG